MIGSGATEIVAKIADSAQAFRATPPDCNAALVNARVALETLAADVAADIASSVTPTPAYTRPSGARCLPPCAAAEKSRSKRRKA